MASNFMESFINSRLDDENAESDTESDIDIDAEQRHNSIDDILDAEVSENPSTSGDEARTWSIEMLVPNFWGNLELLPLPQPN